MLGSFHRRKSGLDSKQGKLIWRNTQPRRVMWRAVTGLALACNRITGLCQRENLVRERNGQPKILFNKSFDHCNGKGLSRAMTKI